MLAAPCYPWVMRAVLGVLLALLFAVHTAYAASPRPIDCCEEMCGDVYCVSANCACQPLTLPAMSLTHLFLAFEPTRAATSLVILDKRIEDIWRPPWQLV